MIPVGVFYFICVVLVLLGILFIAVGSPINKETQQHNNVLLITIGWLLIGIAIVILVCARELYQTHTKSILYTL